MNCSECYGNGYLWVLVGEIAHDRGYTPIEEEVECQSCDGTGLARCEQCEDRGAAYINNEWLCKTCGHTLLLEQMKEGEKRLSAVETTLWETQQLHKQLVEKQLGYFQLAAELGDM